MASTITEHFTGATTNTTQSLAYSLFSSFSVRVMVRRHQDATTTMRWRGDGYRRKRCQDRHGAALCGPRAQPSSDRRACIVDGWRDGSCRRRIDPARPDREARKESRVKKEKRREEGREHHVGATAAAYTAEVRGVLLLPSTDSRSAAKPVPCGCCRNCNTL